MKQLQEEVLQVGMFLVEKPSAKEVILLVQDLGLKEI